jgi:hypothetical protein
MRRLASFGSCHIPVQQGVCHRMLVAAASHLLHRIVDLGPSETERRVPVQQVPCLLMLVSVVNPMRRFVGFVHPGTERRVPVQQQAVHLRMLDAVASHLMCHIVSLGPAGIGRTIGSAGRRAAAGVRGAGAPRRRRRCVWPGVA